MRTNEIQFSLTYRQEAIRIFSFPSYKAYIRIGRLGFGADIEIDSLLVSRQHAEIEVVAPDRLILRDQQSTNGTYVNGLQIQEASLSPGDVISF
ncbi:MAG: FHA domain-containing protein, partial [Bacteroidia bacterium]|nr:FHA domain-containing protein [Bacteroidia bacterium]